MIFLKTGRWKVIIVLILRQDGVLKLIFLYPIFMIIFFPQMETQSFFYAAVPGNSLVVNIF